MKILSDFDGVWTNQALEAESVKLYLAAEAARLANVAPDVALEHFRDFEAAVRGEPQSFGWAPDGRLTAYVDEDPFCVPNALALFVERGTCDVTARYRDAILDGGFEHMTAFADHCFMTAAGRYREEHPPALVPGAAEILHELHARGAEVVVVSNSPSEKIVGWFTSVGADAGVGTGHDLRVRGKAGKQTIGSGSDSITVGERRILVDRPDYRRIIEEEQPDWIIGDVFSLDLALPHVMRTEGHPAAPARLVLRQLAHTPSWILDTRGDGAIDHVVGDVGELLDLIEA